MPFRNVPFAFPVLLVEYTGRLFRAGKAVISGELAGVFERLGAAPRTGRRLQKLAAGQLLGRFFAASRARLREVAERLKKAGRAEESGTGLKKAGRVRY